MSARYNACGPVETGTGDLRMERMEGWARAEWMPRFPDAAFNCYLTNQTCVHQGALSRYDRTQALPGDVHFAGYDALDCDILAEVSAYDYDGEPAYRTGAYAYRFEREGVTVEVLVMSAHYADDGYHYVTMVCCAEEFLPVWHAFANECHRLVYALTPENEVIIIGGHRHAFVPTVNWDEVILPPALKDDLMTDVESFFTKGVQVYQRLKLKPFRKLLLAGVPGTGKTMLCSALAKWALAQGYLVIYVSSAQREPGQQHGATFDKIEQALSIAANSALPSMILLEELDAYLHREEKALVLNVLDGSEAPINQQGTLLIATTNYPEAIDERILKRPGRLDRIFIIPEAKTQVDAEAMLRQYVGVLWRDEHRALVPELTGYPGAFIREVAVHALTQVAYEDGDTLSLEMLRRSYLGLKEQLAARDDFLKTRPPLALQPNGGNGSNGVH